jgi:hypothetical protein
MNITTAGSATATGIRAAWIARRQARSAKS